MTPRPTGRRKVPLAWMEAAASATPRGASGLHGVSPGSPSRSSPCKRLAEHPRPLLGFDVSGKEIRFSIELLDGFQQNGVPWLRTVGTDGTSFDVARFLSVLPPGVGVDRVLAAPWILDEVSLRGDRTLRFTLSDRSDQPFEVRCSRSERCGLADHCQQMVYRDYAELYGLEEFEP